MEINLETQSHSKSQLGFVVVVVVVCFGTV